MSKEILITGASGFIGNRLAEVLVASGQPVRLLARDPDRLSALLRESCQVIHGGLDDKDALLAATRQVAIVFHCAANVRLWDRWDAYYRANVKGVELLLQAIMLNNNQLPRLVHLSSADVYGFPRHACNETAPLNDAGFFYGRSKILGEKLIRKFNQQSGLPYTILRPCNVIGPRSPFIDRIGRELASGLMMTVDGGYGNAGLLYIDNLVDLMIRTATTDLTLNQCYNVRDSYDVSWKDFLERFRQEINGKGRVINMSFGVATALAVTPGVICRVLGVRREPLLHPLLVRIFGRTCGHRTEKIETVCGPVTRCSFDEALEISCRWLQQEMNG